MDHPPPPPPQFAHPPNASESTGKYCNVTGLSIFSKVSVLRMVKKLKNGYDRSVYVEVPYFYRIPYWFSINLVDKGLNLEDFIIWFAGKDLGKDLRQRNRTSRVQYCRSGYGSIWYWIGLDPHQFVRSGPGSASRSYWSRSGRSESVSIPSKWKSW
jgi:hypothetical protein